MRMAMTRGRLTVRCLVCGDGMDGRRASISSCIRCPSDVRSVTRGYSDDVCRPGGYLGVSLEAWHASVFGCLPTTATIQRKTVMGGDNRSDLPDGLTAEESTSSPEQRFGHLVLETVRDTISHHLAQAVARTPDETAFTFVDFSSDREGVRSYLTWRQLDKRVRTLTTALRRTGAGGERVAVVAPQNLDYVVGFLAITCAGAIAVPLFPPDLPGHAEKLAAVLADADPVLALTSPDSLQAAEKFCANQDGCRVRVVTEQDLLSGPAAGGVPTGGETLEPHPQDCAYLQYTSGSTRLPSGVEISHANVCANARQALEAYDIRSGRNFTVGWLPLYHDMGLVLAIVLSVVGHVPSVLMDPLAFIQQPVRWLRLLTQHPGALTAAPNFAYDYCARRVTDEERGELSLGSVAAMVNGSEPIAEQTLRRFQQAFAPVGRPAQPCARRTGWPKRPSSSPPHRLARNRPSPASTGRLWRPAPREWPRTPKHKR